MSTLLILMYVTAALTSDAALIDLALSDCSHLSEQRPAKLSRATLHAFLLLERVAEVPPDYRGMSLGKACIESGFDPAAVGDCWGGQCRAKGVVQLWPWAESFGVDRSNPIASVHFLLQRIRLGADGWKIKARCQDAKTPEQRWLVAWIRINRGPRIRRKGKFMPRCSGIPHGLSELRRWKSKPLPT